MASTEETVLEKMRRWVADATTIIGVFENQDLGHPEGGKRIALPFATSQAAALVVNKTQAPDGRYGLGWRYVLVAATIDPLLAYAALQYAEREPVVGQAATLLTRCRDRHAAAPGCAGPATLDSKLREVSCARCGGRAYVVRVAGSLRLVACGYREPPEKGNYHFLAAAEEF